MSTSLKWRSWPNCLTNTVPNPNEDVDCSANPESPIPPRPLSESLIKDGAKFHMNRFRRN
ncbi:hypothetical protein RHMOL_Rhmol05G0024100 [Rhododendron molle]|uniref:Uncharacterized protein n=1 Tax=Rhododendron molle TaxID=49168 RepID=A0ACC0NK10_RHOML|nr:hypothetical protein RHMOL_Rhmol05G0024100 [Rhododendron molle]